MKVWQSSRVQGRHVVLWAAAILSSAVASRASVTNNAGITQAITVSEGTNIAFSVSPDQRTILMDLQGVLWSVPIGGGNATRLTDDFLEPARPDWSPTGDRVTFEAYAGGTFHVWMMNPDGSGVTQLTDGHYDDREPRFSPDGTKIAFSSDRGLAADGTRRYEVWVLDIASGNLVQRTSGPAEEFEPAWSPDGSEIAFVNGSANGNTIDVIMPPVSGARSFLPIQPPASIRRLGRQMDRGSPTPISKRTRASSRFQAKRSRPSMTCFPSQLSGSLKMRCCTPPTGRSESQT